MFFKVQHESDHLEDLVKHILQDPIEWVSDLVGLGSSSRNNKYHKFSGDADTAGPGSTHWEPLIQSKDSKIYKSPKTEGEKTLYIHLMKVTGYGAHSSHLVFK